MKKSFRKVPKKEAEENPPTPNPKEGVKKVPVPKPESPEKSSDAHSDEGDVKAKVPKGPEEEEKKEAKEVKGKTVKLATPRKVLAPPPPKKQIRKVVEVAPREEADPKLISRLRPKLRELAKLEKKGYTPENKKEVLSYIGDLPEPGSKEYKSLDGAYQGAILAAYHRAETATKTLITNSELTASARLDLCKLVHARFRNIFDELVVDLLDCWKYLRNQSNAVPNELFTLLCKTTFVPDNAKLKIAVTLFNGGNLTGECFECVASSSEASIGDRVEACKFLLAIENPEGHELAQEVMCKIIEDPASMEVEFKSENTKAVDALNDEVLGDGSRSSADEEEDSSDEDSSDGVPDWLASSEEEDLEEGKGKKKKTLKPKKKDPYRVPTKKTGNVISNAAKKDKKKAIAEDRKHQERSQRRYSLILPFLATKKIKIKGERGGPDKIILVPSIKTFSNKAKLEPAESLDLTAFVNHILILFLNNKENHIRQRISAASVIYGSKSLSSIDSADGETSETDALAIMKKEALDFLFSVGEDTTQVEDVRGDALDYILRLSKGEVKRRANKLVLELGAEADSSGNKSLSNKIKTIYRNTQNVHDENVSGAVLEFIEQMDPTIDTFSFVEVVGSLGKYYQKKEISAQDRYRARTALFRIESDSSTFGENNFSVKKIFTYIWTLIQAFRNFEEPIKAYDKKFSGEEAADLLEEKFVNALIEMGETCSSGHVSRLVQVMEGFGFKITISYHEQVIANVSGRIAAKAASVTDPELKEALEMGVLEEAEEEHKTAYHDWLTKELSSLDKILSKEFAGLMSKSDYQAAFAEARKMLLAS